MFPVINARLMIACAVRVASWPWLTPIVHQKETRFPSAMVPGELLQLLRAQIRFRRTTRSGVNGVTNSGELREARGMRFDECRDRSSR